MGKLLHFPANLRKTNPDYLPVDTVCECGRLLGQHSNELRCPIFVGKELVWYSASRFFRTAAYQPFYQELPIL